MTWTKDSKLPLRPRFNYVYFSSEFNFHILYIILFILNKSKEFVHMIQQYNLGRVPTWLIMGTAGHSVCLVTLFPLVNGVVLTRSSSCYIVMEVKLKLKFEEPVDLTPTHKSNEPAK
jgi:hypothetical protein